MISTHVLIHRRWRSPIIFSSALKLDSKGNMPLRSMPHFSSSENDADSSRDCCFRTRSHVKFRKGPVGRYFRWCMVSLRRAKAKLLVRFMPIDSTFHVRLAVSFSEVRQTGVFRPMNASRPWPWASELIAKPRHSSREWSLLSDLLSRSVQFVEWSSVWFTSNGDLDLLTVSTIPHLPVPRCRNWRLHFSLRAINPYVTTPPHFLSGLLNLNDEWHATLWPTHAKLFSLIQQTISVHLNERDLGLSGVIAAGHCDSPESGAEFNFVEMDSRFENAAVLQLLFSLIIDDLLS
jgi:hypothetical protein